MDVDPTLDVDGHGDAALRIEGGGDVHAVARLETGYVKLCPTQYFLGYTFFSAKLCVNDLVDTCRSPRQCFQRAARGDGGLPT